MLQVQRFVSITYKKMFFMATAEDSFLDLVRAAEWQQAQLVLDSGEVSLTACPMGLSVFPWLIENNAPATLVVSLIERYRQTVSIDLDRAGLLESCMKESSTKGNAFKTFCALLQVGFSPNIITECGETLLQSAMRLNKTCEVKMLIEHGADPYQMSVFGIESTSNLQEAKSIQNEASVTALQEFTKQGRGL